jgi:hypothetical protein
MTVLSIEHRDLLHSLEWYMTARKTALRSAMSFRTQLSVPDQTDMRIHYSGYFQNLIAAIDLVRDTKSLHPNNDIEARLKQRLVFAGFPDGEGNYMYVRELRNSVIHRGLDITSAAHIDGNFPMILAEPKVRNVTGAKFFVTFDKYLLHVIAKCESIVGPAILECLHDAGLFQATIDTSAAEVEYRQAIEDSHAMSDRAKALARTVQFDPARVVSAHQSTLVGLREMLQPCDSRKPG